MWRYTDTDEGKRRWFRGRTTTGRHHRQVPRGGSRVLTSQRNDVLPPYARALPGPHNSWCWGCSPMPRASQLCATGRWRCRRWAADRLRLSRRSEKRPQREEPPVAAAAALRPSMSRAKYDSSRLPRRSTENVKRARVSAVPFIHASQSCKLRRTPISVAGVK